MKDFYVHFCHHNDNILRRYDVSIIHSKDIDLNRYSNLVWTVDGILIMQKMFRDYLYNTFTLYNPYPEWSSVTVQLTSNLQDFVDNNVKKMSFFKIDNQTFIYGFKALSSTNTVTLYVYSI